MINTPDGDMAPCSKKSNYDKFCCYSSIPIILTKGTAYHLYISKKITDAVYII